MKRVIGEAWENFSRSFGDFGAPPLALDSMRMAFYLGAATTFTVLVNQLNGGGEGEPTDEDLRLIASIDLELKEHVAGLRRQG